MLEFSNFIEVFRDILQTFAGRLRTDCLPAWRSVRNSDGEPIEKVSFFLPQGQKNYQTVYWKAEVRKQCITMYSFIIYRQNLHYFWTFRFMTLNIPGTFCPYRTVRNVPGVLLCTSRNSEHVCVPPPLHVHSVQGLSNYTRMVRQTKPNPLSNIFLWFGNLHGVVGTDSLLHRSVYWKAWEHNISSFLYILDNVHIYSF